MPEERMPAIFIVGFNKGISLAVAKRFAREGFAVGAIARSEASLAQIAEVAALSVPTAVQRADAAQPDALRAALCALATTLGDARVLVYNCAGFARANLSELPLETLNAALAVSVGGALVATQTVLPAMQATGSGTILYTGGRFGISPSPPIAALGIGKAAMRNLALVVARELAPLGLRAGTVTVAGTVGTSATLMPDAIAEHYWNLHTMAEAPEELTVD
jgi:short-subunit dehydrogenase